MGTTTEVEEHEVADHPAAHHLVGRDGGVEAAGHQYQHLLQRAQRIAAKACVLFMDDEQAVMADFHAHFDFGLLQVDPGRIALLAQAATHVSLHIDGGERVLASALAAHGEDLARQLVAEVRLALGKDVVEIAQRVFVHFEEMADARRAGQALDHLAQDLRLGHPCFELEIVPLAFHQQLWIEVAQHRANVLRQLPDEALAHRPALDGDFLEDLDDEFHVSKGPVTASLKKGARLYPKLLKT
ncbi:hypothetical protein D9M71_378910 [compost metagenome]